MRILYVLNTLAIGGAERLVLSLGERMAARGHEVRVVALGPERPDELPTHLEVTRLGMDKHPARAFSGVTKGARILRQFRPHILHSHNFHGNMLARALVLTCRSAKVVATLHNEYEGGRVRMLALKLTDFLTECSVAVSQAVAERAQELRIVPPEKCRVILNGVDIASLTPDEQRRASSRSAMGAHRDFIWLSAGRLVPAKDYGNLLLAFSQVYAAAPETQLWIAGDGDAEYAEALQIKAANLGLTPAVNWLGGRRDIAALLDAADAFVLGSAWEGMPLAIAEAMAMEKPVAATGVGGVGELVERCGLTVPPRDPHALARAMLSIMNTPAKARRFLGQSARQRIVDHFNIERKADEWEALYRAVCGGIS
ncbi:glycosyltransferase [Occallatibacter riparius]|uniref:Glycosyltransferase n=1 Tax=Occallatibacter riparius TaxID=1002689 RepID=A0A9J7BMJ0_9BACT|nr:glycosyltransferase [Occallatibacter riparius]UWZ82413.1 glycosyltransferase [Occallatibacter riparius]